MSKEDELDGIRIAYGRMGQPFNEAAFVEMFSSSLPIDALARFRAVAEDVAWNHSRWVVRELRREAI